VPSASEVVRESFLSSAAEARGLIAAREVAAQWHAPSALELLEVGAVAGHLARAAFVVAGYLDTTDPESTRDAELLTADAYFERIIEAASENADAHAAIRARSAQEAAAGQEALVARLDATLHDLDQRFASEPEARAVRVAGGIVMPLDEYLVTRMVELVVHTDDLAASVGLETPEFDALTMACVIGCMLAMVRSRHGDIAVVRSFARRERDAVNAIRAF
jgi:Mycothiol maleylpyruvate isomerase N-terminal domain